MPQWVGRKVSFAFCFRRGSDEKVLWARNAHKFTTHRFQNMCVPKLWGRDPPGLSEPNQSWASLASKAFSEAHRDHGAPPTSSAV